VGKKVTNNSSEEKSTEVVSGKEDVAACFVKAVMSYLDLIDRSDQIEPYELLSRCTHILPEVYRLGLLLPDLDVSDDVVEEIVVDSPSSRLLKQLGRYDVYSEVSDPFIGKDIVHASLADDLSGVYLDLKAPLLHFQGGSRSEAIWEWRFNIRSHCGDHIVDAMRIIHRLVHDHMDPDFAGD